MQLLFENAPVGIAQCNREGRILTMNSALRKMVGEALQALDYLSFADLVRLPDQDLSMSIFRQLISGERTNFQVESVLGGSDIAGAVRLRWTAWGVRGRSQNPDCVLLAAEDITQSRSHEQKAQQAEGLQSLGRMAGSVAHDFNNLLTGILLYCDLMRNGLGDKLSSVSSPAAMLPERERLRSYVEEIRSASIQAAGVVQQLLTVTRPGNPNPRPVSLNALVEQMRNLLLRLVGENIELSFYLDPNLGLVRIDPAQAQQILLNLVLNGRDAMPDGGRIQVETANCNAQIFRDPVAEIACSMSDRAATTARVTAIPCVLFVVSDNGGGMNEETRQRVFEAYFTTKDGVRGSGLGLSTVHNIVASRGGLVQVESASGSGTRVIVLLPSLDSPQVPPAREPQLASSEAEVFKEKSA